jgi:hypothetical protein
LVGALITGSNGNLRQPVWIMNPVNALSVSLTQNAGGDFPFAAEMARGFLQGYPVLLSARSRRTPCSWSTPPTSSRPVATNRASTSAIRRPSTWRIPRRWRSVLPARRTPSPLQSGRLWQTDTIGLRMILDMNWAMRRTGVVAYVTSVTW